MITAAGVDTTIGDSTGRPDTLILEAEKARLSGAVVSSSNPGFTGTGFADYVNASADFVEFTVNANVAGNYTLGFRYANGAAVSRPLQIRVNGSVVRDTFPFPATGSWSTWKYVSLNGTFKVGSNTVRATATGSSGGNLDHLQITGPVGAPSLPRITRQPLSQTVTRGQRASFSVGVSSATPMTYQWQKNGVRIDSARDSIYTTPPADSTMDSSSYRVIVSNSAGSVTSNPAILRVNRGAVPQITRQPLSQTVNRGQRASFSVGVSSATPMTYQWQKNGVRIDSARDSVYTTPPADSTMDSSSYRVIVSNSAGSVTSNPAILRVNRGAVPQITRQPLSQTVTRGQRASFSVGVSSATPMTYQWQKNGVRIDSARDSVYTTPPADSTMDSSSYRVIVSNSAGSVTSNTASLRVIPALIDSVRYEAENASRSGAVIATNYPGFTGTGFVDFVNASGDSLGWTVTAASAKTFSLTFRYANGASASRPLKITVNGITVSASFAFPPTGSWQTWSTVTLNAALKAGSNKVGVMAIGSSGGNLDNLVVR